MKLYLKGFYGYKNFGDEMLFFGLLNYLQKNYNPESITVEVGDKQRMQTRVSQNKEFLDTGILDKLEYVENTENSIFIRRLNHILALLGFSKYRKYFKVFGGGEVLDESRKFPHNGRNLILLHSYAIRKKNFILLGGIGPDTKKSTKVLYKYLLPKAQTLIFREKTSVSRAKKYIRNNSSIVLHKDFSSEILDDKRAVIANLGSNPYTEKEKNRQISRNISGAGYSSQGHDRHNNILINISPKYFSKKNLNKIKEFVEKKTASHARNDSIKKIFFPADINFDKKYYAELRKMIPNLELYDRTKHSLFETIDLFKNSTGGVGSRLHFLYPLKIFKQKFLSISNSDKVKKMINIKDPGVK